MKKYYLLISIFILISTSQFKSQVIFTYPETKKEKQYDVYFGDTIYDPYRWLENQTADETKNWVEKQNKITRNYLDKIPNYFTLHEQIKRNTQIEYFTPTKKGKYYFVLMTKFGGKDLSIYFKKDFINDYDREYNWEELFVTKDLKINKEEHINVSQYELSKNSKYIAFAFDKNGSDWKEIKIGDLEKQKNLDDHLFDIKFTNIVWRGNGFYYTKYERANANEQYKQVAVNGKLYYHTIGTTQDKDSLIFKKSDGYNNHFNVTVTNDERYVIIDDNDPVNNTHAYYYFDFNNKEQKGLLPLIKKSNNAYHLLGNNNDSLLFSMTINKEKKVISIDPKNPKKWVEKIKSIGSLIVQDVYYYDHKFYELCFYNQQHIIVVFDAQGNIIKKVEIPIGASCDFKGVDEETNQLLFSYQSYLHPPIFAAMNLSTYKFELLEKVKISYDMSSFEIKKIEYTSDSVTVPMILMYKKDLKLDGNNPILLEYYGGFGVITTGAYDAGKIAFVENGGVYAFAMIRGGGEKGKEWHKAGALFNRQKSINDIANAAKYLIEKKYTNTSKIAISGSSHGGLMTAAVAMQYPNLFSAAIPVVGDFDAIRTEKFTVGSFHTDEFGTVKDSLQFINIKSYSPLHNIKKGVKYPSMLIMTSDFDDRVPPLHSYKFAATMQELAEKQSPILLRVEKNAGHDGARNYEKYIDMNTDFYGFILHTLSVGKYK